MDIDKLERLQKLKDSGALTEEEFQKEKEKLLNQNETTPPPVQPQYQPYQQNQYQQKPKKKQNGCLVAIGIVLVLWGIGSYLLHMTRYTMSEAYKISNTTQNE